MCRSMQLLLGPGLLAVEGESLPSWVSYITDATGIAFRGATQTAAQDADTCVLHQTFARYDAFVLPSNMQGSVAPVGYGHSGSLT